MTISYEQQVTSLSPSVWFKFNETAGTPTNSGSLSCSLTGSATLNNPTGVDGRSVFFPGTSGSAYTASTFPEFSLFDDKSFSIEFWFKLDSTQSENDDNLTIFKVESLVPNFSRIRIMVKGTGSGQTTNPGKLAIYTSGAIGTREIFSTVTVNDNQWHHAVATFNTSSIKLYLDGAVNINSTPAATPSRYYFDNLTYGFTIGKYATGSNEDLYKGYLDEFAIYNRELTSTEINANYVYGSAVYVDAEVTTASSTIVSPTWSTESNNLAVPATASAAMGDVQVSNFNTPSMLRDYLASLSLEQWFEFESNIIQNSGSGGQYQATAFGRIGTVTEQIGNGPAGRYSLELGATAALGSMVSNSSASPMLYTTEMSDNNFAYGIWFKFPTTLGTNTKVVMNWNGANDTQTGIEVRNKKAYLYLNTSSTTYSYTGSADLNDNQWHLAVIRFNLADNTYYFYLDGSQVQTGTTTGTRSTPTQWNLGSGGTTGDTYRFNVADFFVGTYSGITGTEISNIWNAGNVEVQAGAGMPDPIVRFNNAYNDYSETLQPVASFRFNASGAPVNYGTEPDKWGMDAYGTNYTTGHPTKNNFAYRVTNKNTGFAGGYQMSTGQFSDNQLSMSVYGNFGTVSGADNQIIGLMGAFSSANIWINGASQGPQVIFGAAGGGGNWRIINSNDTSLFGGYHLYTATRNGSTGKFYVDGKLIGTSTTLQGTFTDTNSYTIGGYETAYLGASAATVDKYIDEALIFDYTLSDKQVFELWQSLAIDGPGTTNASFVEPTLSLGFGPTINSGVAYASALLVDPAQEDTTNQLPVPATAFATINHPNYFAEVFLNAIYGAAPATASALLHMPQYEIGEFNSADHMNASALFVNPQVSTPGTVSANPMIGQDATLVNPGVVVIKGFREYAEPMKATSILVLPPAYVSLEDDQWYVRLITEHADRKTEPVQAYLSNLPNQKSTDIIAGGFLGFFNSVTTDITPKTTPNYISNKIPGYFFKTIGTYELDDNGNIVGLDESVGSAGSIATRNSLNPTPILSKGYFDDKERKAVRFENIEFILPGTNINHSIRPWHLEFSIRTTKSNQVLAYGKWESFYYYQRSIGTIGLYNGKISLMESAQPIGGAAQIPHPSNKSALAAANLNSTQYMLGNQRIDDDQWHHVVIQQGYDDGRTQIWIDGKLDKQLGVTTDRQGQGNRYGVEPGFNGTNKIRPYIIGFNSDNADLYSDFQTSGWNFLPGRFIGSGEIGLNYQAYGKWTPVKAEPMIASIKATDDNKAIGNKSRALLLYWGKPSDRAGYSYATPRDEITFASDLITADEKGKPPQDFNGWDIFPVSITGTGVSEINKNTVWGAGNYKDDITGAPRYLHVLNDLDLSQFDAIFFKDYPESSTALDTLLREQYADSYFELKEKDLYDDFIKSLRAAVDTGISLFVSSHRLALDLGIVDRVETIPVFDEIVNNELDFSDYRAPVITGHAKLDENDNYYYNGPDDIVDLKIAPDTAAGFLDVHDNRKHRVINTIPYLTDDASYVITDRAYYMNDDRLDYAGPDRYWGRYEYRLNGLQPGDEFLFGDISPRRFGMALTHQRSIKAVPFENVKAGKIITAQPLQYWKKNTLVDNPYANYAHSIAIEENDLLNGTPVGGKIYVNFSEVFWDQTPEYYRADLATDYWIDIAFDLGLITEEKRNEYKTSRDYTSNSATGPDAEVRRYWSYNGDFVFLSVDNGDIYSSVLGLLFDDDNKFKGIPITRKGLPSSSRARDKLGRFTSGIGGGGGLPFAKLEYGRYVPNINVYVPNMLTRGFWWLSDRIRYTGLVYRSEAMTATVNMPLGLAKPDKSAVINASSMIANANIGNVQGLALNSTNILVLPMTANGLMVVLGKNILAPVYAVNADMMRPSVITFAAEPIILTVSTYQPTLYLRGDKIK